MRVLIDFPVSATRLRYAFSQPQQILVAHQHNEVQAVIRAAEQHAHAGRWCIGFVTYEAAPALERALTTHAPGPLPLAWFAVFTSAQAWPENSPIEHHPYATTAWQDQTPPEQFAQHFAQIKNAIESGATYQINYTTRLHSTFSGDPLAYFQALQRTQANGYCAYIETADWQICSVSPELFFDWHHDTITTQPMKGTSARGHDPHSDQARADTLRHSRKEQAENLMIVDLLRNDLGRIAQTGTVKVPALFELQALPTAWQMTSTITAQTQANTQLVDIFAALFPCGSVTGAPKVKAMQYIAQLESSTRGVYCGAIGILQPARVGAVGSSADKRIRATFNVAIRTVVIQHNHAECGIGSGITWDADCQAEQNEFAIKQRFLARAAQAFALLETLKLENGNYWLLDQHLARLQHSAQHFAYSLNLASVESTLNQVAANYPQGTWRVRLRVQADGQCQTEVGALAPNPAQIQVQLATHALASDQEFLFHKTTQRSVYEPFQPSDPQVFDTLLWNERAELTEFTRGNLVLDIAGERYTPSIQSGLLAGCLRAQLLQDGQITEKVLYKTDLARADKIWFINSVRGWLAVQLHAS